MYVKKFTNLNTVHHESQEKNESLGSEYDSDFLNDDSKMDTGE